VAKLLATGWTIGVKFPEGAGISHFAIASRLAQWVQGALYLKLKRPEREADKLPPPSAELQDAWSVISPPHIRLHGVVHRGRENFTVTNIHLG
jgi:hypothetical protein